MELKAQKHRTKYVELPVEGLRTGVRFPPAPPTPKPQPETVGGFYCVVLAPLPVLVQAPEHLWASMADRPDVKLQRRLSIYIWL